MLCIHPCLCVCLLAGLLKKSWTDLNEILWKGSQLPKYHSINIGGDPDSRSGFRIQNIISLKSLG